MLRVLPPGSAVLPRARKCLLPVYTFILLGVDYLGWLSELRSIGARSDGLGGPQVLWVIILGPRSGLQPLRHLILLPSCPLFWRGFDRFLILKKLCAVLATLKLQFYW